MTLYHVAYFVTKNCVLVIVDVDFSKNSDVYGKKKRKLDFIAKQENILRVEDLSEGLLSSLPSYIHFLYYFGLFIRPAGLCWSMPSSRWLIQLLSL